MQLDQSYLGSTIFLLQIAFSFTFIAWNISSWLVIGKKKKHCMFLSMYLSAIGRRLSDDEPQGWDLVHLRWKWNFDPDFCSQTPTTEPADLRPWKWWVFEGLGILPKICNFFPNVGGWYKILEVSQVVYVSDSGLGCFAVYVLYIYLEPEWPAFWRIWPIKWCRSPPQKRGRLGSRCFYTFQRVPKKP